MSGFTKLSSDFNRGYTKAITDIIHVFQYVNHDLRCNKMRMNYNWAEKILTCCLENREKLRDDWPGFIRTEKSESGKRDIVKYYDPRNRTVSKTEIVEEVKK